MPSTDWPAALAAELTHWRPTAHGPYLRLRCGPHELRALPPGTGAVSEAWKDVGPPLPQQLVELWRAHDGIGLAGDERALIVAPALRPSAAVRPLSAFVRFGENDVLFEPAAWWWVVAAGPGGWCVDGQGRVAAWDAHRHTLGPPEPLDRMWEALAAAWAALRHQA